MECYSEQICAIFVDDELPVDEARRLRDHLATCQRCRRSGGRIARREPRSERKPARPPGRNSQPRGLIPSALVLGMG